MSAERWADVVDAATPNEIYMLRIADAVQQKLFEERSFKKFMRPPFVGECASMWGSACVLIALI